MSTFRSVSRDMVSHNGDAGEAVAGRQPLLIVEGLRKYFAVGGGPSGSKTVVKAVDDVSFYVGKNETLGIVGESGCGKSTTARLLMRLAQPDAGEILLDGESSGYRGCQSVRAFRRDVQLVFQDSYASLNPRLTLEEAVAFGPRVIGLRRAAARSRAHQILDRVGLPPASFAKRRPHELSGGQRQRANIARALAMHPRVLIFDEAVSALDKSIQAQVLNLLRDLKQELQLTYIFISHDLGVVRYISDRVLVMYLGKVVEIGPVDFIYKKPQHPYTRALLASRPSMNPRNRSNVPPITGDPPSPIDPPSGCRFHTRCALSEPLCSVQPPPLVAHEGETAHLVACHARTLGSGHSLAGAIS